MSSGAGASAGISTAYRPGYEVVKEVGKGSFGMVILARERATGEEVAVKVMQRYTEDVTLWRYLEAEVLNQRLLRHPHIIVSFVEEMREVFEYAPGLVGIVMEYASGGSLHAYVSRRKRLPEDEARWFFQQLALTLDFCHKRKVAHRDIKLENLLLAPSAHAQYPMLKLADFGFSKAFMSKNPMCHSHVGTLAYMAPEVITATAGSPGTYSYNGIKSDVWSCGVVLYNMLYGVYPFGAGDKPGPQRLGQAEVMERVLRGEWAPVPGVQVSETCFNLLQSMLLTDPGQRPTMEDILQHPWFMHALPPGALEYNAHLLALNKELELNPQDAGLQSVEDIRAVLWGGHHRPGSGDAPTGPTSTQFAPAASTAAHQALQASAVTQVAVGALRPPAAPTSAGAAATVMMGQLHKPLLSSGAYHSSPLPSSSPQSTFTTAGPSASGAAAEAAAGVACLAVGSDSGGAQTTTGTASDRTGPPTS